MEQRFFAVSTATVIDTQSSFPTWTLAFIFQAVSCFLVLTLRGTPNNAAKQLSQNTTPVIILLLNFSKRSPVSTVKIKPFIAWLHFDLPLSRGGSPMQQGGGIYRHFLGNTSDVFGLLVPSDWRTAFRDILPHLLLFLKAIYSTHLFGSSGSQLKHSGYFYPHWGMWDPVPWSGIKSGLPALSMHTLSHGTTRELTTSFSIAYSHSRFSVMALLTR